MYLKYKQWWHKWGQTYQTHQLSACKSLHCILRGMWRNLRIPTYQLYMYPVQKIWEIIWVTYICTWNRCNYLQTSSRKKICHACNTYIYNNRTDTHPLFSDPNKAQSTWMSKADPFSHPLNVWIYKLAGTSKCTQTTEASSFPTTVVKTAVILWWCLLQ